ncbi:hypothetical protein [Pseudomonas sp. W2-17]|uniref:hypothetical protein n=1 Tax=Pseudomonas sp. W2-17 TaxID=3058039 RepID=UPI0034E0DE57
MKRLNRNGLEADCLKGHGAAAVPFEAFAGIGDSGLDLGSLILAGGRRSELARDRLRSSRKAEAAVLSDTPHSPNAAASRQIESKLTPTRSSSEPNCAASIQAMVCGDHTFAIPSDLKNLHSSSPVINISKRY